jgi:deoxyribonuclease-4
MRLGAHVSIRGSLDLAVARAQALGCECLQIFYGSPRQWRPASYAEDVIARFVQRRRAAQLDPLVAHAAYLVNPAAAHRTHRRRSIASLLATARGVERLGGLAVITHMGSRAGAPRSEALRRVADAVREILGGTRDVMVLLENSAGAGGSLGADFGDFGDVLGLLDGDPRVGVCLDTAHLFAAGWDLRHRDGIDAMVDAFDRAAGWTRVRVLHLNDSKAPLASRLDRHENIGEGYLGIDAFRAIVAHARLRTLPGIIETPGFDREGPDRRNLTRLKRLRGDRPGPRRRVPRPGAGPAETRAVSGP